MSGLRTCSAGHILDHTFPNVALGGITDRHLIVSKDDLNTAIDFLTEMMKNVQLYYDEMLRFSNWNLERFLYLHYMRRGLIPRIRRYPYIMASVRGEKDGWTINPGTYDQTENLTIKYTGELNSARAFRDVLTDKAAWIKFFADGGFDRLEDLTPQPFAKFEERATRAKWAINRILDKLGVG
jgi:hypothetical protein